MNLACHFLPMTTKTKGSDNYSAKATGGEQGGREGRCSLIPYYALQHEVENALRGPACHCEAPKFLLLPLEEQPDSYSLQRCLELFAGATCGSSTPDRFRRTDTPIASEFASGWLSLQLAKNVWEGRMVAALCTGPYWVSAFNVRELIQGETNQVEYRVKHKMSWKWDEAIATKVEIAFLAHLIVSVCPRSAFVEVTFKREKRAGKVLLAPGLGLTHYLHKMSPEQGMTSDEEGDTTDDEEEQHTKTSKLGEEKQVLSLQKMDLCIETLALLTEAALAARPVRGCACSGQEQYRPQVGTQASSVASLQKIELGQNPILGLQGKDAMKLIVQLALVTAGKLLQVVCLLQCCVDALAILFGEKAIANMFCHDLTVKRLCSAPVANLLICV